MHLRLVAFEGNDVPAILSDDLPDDFLLTSGGVDGNNGALDVEQIQQIGDCRDFVRFFVLSLLTSEIL